MTNPAFNALLDEMRRTHDLKNSDYANDDPYSNFRFAADLSEGFTDSLDKVFATMIGIKLARLIELTKPGRVPKNEAIGDTYLDLANYAAIWASLRRGEYAAVASFFSPPTYTASCGHCHHAKTE